MEKQQNIYILCCLLDYSVVDPHRLYSNIQNHIIKMFSHAFKNKYIKLTINNKTSQMRVQY